jgi:hypothetical protein
LIVLLFIDGRAGRELLRQQQEVGLAGRVDGPVQDVLVESGQEADIGAASALEVLVGTDDRRHHLLHGSPVDQEIGKGVQPERVGGAVQIQLVKILDLILKVLEAALDLAHHDGAANSKT